MNCRVYLVRHGETEWNATMRFQGQTDVELSKQGKKQACALAERLQKVEFGGIYSSNLNRAYETASIIAAHHNLKVEQERGFGEINFGAWEGLTYKEIQQKYSRSAARWWQDPLATRVPGGESLGDVVDRSMATLLKTCKIHADQTVLIVTHGGVVKSIISSVLGMDLNQYWRLKQDNLALNIVYFPQWEKGILELFNDCSHLG
ncbi:MAG: alpha-ribazole phosphatase [Firmicutes bacterium]|nr:alpha-ribazole phosphatase [Bacillota bacterium]